ncbi:MAG: hypothetical protein PF636_04050 [Actinomycetota bacterium]|nr:hypothetical protein [Actinomycetota bacterium]
MARTGSGFTVDVALHVVGLAATSWLFWNTAMYGAVTRQEPDSFFLRGLLRTHELSTDDVAPVSRTPFGYTVGLTRCSKTLQPLRLTTGPRPTSSMCPTTEPERK